MQEEPTAPDCLHMYLKYIDPSPSNHPALSRTMAQDRITALPAELRNSFYELVVPVVPR